MGIRVYAQCVVSTWYVTDAYTKTFLYPVAIITGLALGNYVLITYAVIPTPLRATQSVASIILANRINLRAGLLGGVLTVLYHENSFAELVDRATPIQEIIIFFSMFVGIFWLARRPRPGLLGPPQKGIADTDPLPFTSTHRTDDDNGIHGNRMNYWSVQPSGNWGEDALVGTEYARVFADRFMRNARRPLLSWIIRDMIKAGRYTGIEAGFAYYLGALTMGLAHRDTNDPRANGQVIGGNRDVRSVPHG